MDPIQEARLQRDASARAKLVGRAQIEATQEILSTQVDDDSIRQLKQEIADLENAALVKAEHMSAPGALGFPELLERRRWEAGIVDEAFLQGPIGTNVLLYQLKVLEEARAKGSKLYLPTDVKAGERFSASRGIVVGAGLAALDHLYANGVALGHIVRFSKLAVQHIKLSVIINGIQEYLLVLHCTEVRGSEDLGLALLSGQAKLAFKDNKHAYLLPDGSVRDGRSVVDGTSETYDGR